MVHMTELIDALSIHVVRTLILYQIQSARVYRIRSGHIIVQEDSIMITALIQLLLLLLHHLLLVSLTLCAKKWRILHCCRFCQAN